ncbi:MAG: hypothetical protein JOZ46_02075 [Candidatus Dormibacteraeota bacterium]|nr:hypothetical protein [Candidatus Dormibacteraeota bacterium]MBV9524583.1 hypothetical protein [Candidatus Dormibacteraeota bacterium]
MPLFRRSKPAPVVDTSAEDRAAELAARQGTLPCSESGCGATTGIACDYVDRRDRACRTAWCPAHRMVVDERIFCRRHAGVVSSLPADAAQSIPLPDLENRAPSLVGWVARQIDADVWRLMLRELDAATGGQLIADPVALVFIGVERHRAWERAWKLVTHAGEKHRVSILVTESRDAEVEVKVGSNVLDRVVPPWIQHRRDGESVSAEQDVEERKLFNHRLLEAIQRGLTREREIADTMSRAAGTPVLRVAEETDPGR